MGGGGSRPLLLRDVADGTPSFMASAQARVGTFLAVLFP